MSGDAPHAWYEPWMTLVLLLLHGRPAILECGRVHLLRTHWPASTMIALRSCSDVSV